jgi:uncharacterized membrane protein
LIKWTKYLDTPHLFALLALLFGIIFIKVIPPFWGVDEIAHYDRAYQISTGNLMEDRLSQYFYGGKLPSDTVGVQKHVFKDLLNNSNNNQVDSSAFYDNYLKDHPNKNLQSYDFTGSGGYSPLAYAPPAVGIFLGRAAGLTNGGIIFMARFATLLTYIGMVFWAMRILRDNRLIWLIFAIALLPMSLFQASIVNVDALVTGLAILLFALYVDFWRRDKPVGFKWLLVLLLVISWLSLTKPNYLILALLVLFLPSTIFPPGRKIFWRLGLLLIPLTLAVIWIHFASPILHAGIINQKGVEATSTISATHQLQDVVLHPLGFVHTIVSSAVQSKWFDGAIGYLGYNFVLLPGSIITLAAICVVLATFYRRMTPNSPITTNLPYYMLGVGLITAASIIGAFYLQYTSVGASTIDGVQGRYFTPLLPFLLFGIAKIFRVKVEMTSQLATILFGGIVSFALIASTIYYYLITY